MNLHMVGNFKWSFSLVKTDNKEIKVLKQFIRSLVVLNVYYNPTLFRHNLLQN